ncbi:hypothetical protein GGU11DRAFT_796678 [Lentinula aff. detonsa]|uniref:Uncharacterized protein n=1 Tax=Lentinula aff. detonsa TaxID=2804958 RepID=A0AA38NHP1_9AGAR|nr:hypothetical protein GGU10DRAFT_366836 [Lentinula aff. detonsa]KAJ3794312.1 hypothetical protein GGU11DRAFT_796678 [Lentinula aff. detonsa]
MVYFQLGGGRSIPHFRLDERLKVSLIVTGVSAPALTPGFLALQVIARYCTYRSVLLPFSSYSYLIILISYDYLT